MSFVPLPLGLTQGGYFTSGRVLKTYLAGTSTASPMYTDNTGATSTATILYDANGLPTVSGTVVFPHINTAVGDVKYVLYPSQASADANTGALETWDNISSTVASETALATSVEFHLYSEFVADVITLSNAYSPGNNSLSVYRNGVLLGLGAGYDYTETSTTSITLTAAAAAATASDDVFTFKVGAEQTTASLSAASVTYTPSGAGAVTTDVQTRLREVDTQLFYTAATPQVLTGAGAVDITSRVTHIVTTGADALTLADGAENQEKFIVMKTDGGDGTLTPASLANGTTITFDDVGDSAHLLFTNSAWHFMGGTATLA